MSSLNKSDIEALPNLCKFLNRRRDSNRIFEIIKIKNKKKWTDEEDTKLIKIAGKFKEKHWKEVSMYFCNKNALQCFSRYKRIRPGIIKGSWSQEEDDKIIQLVDTYGTSWSKISKVLSSRNGKQIRDRYINVLDPKIKKGKFSDHEDQALIKMYMYYGPKWATIAKHFPNRTADMIKNRFHSSIKKIFFHNNEWHENISLLEKKFKLTIDEPSTKNESKQINSSENKENQATVNVTNQSNYSISPNFDSNNSNNFQVFEQIRVQINNENFHNFSEDFVHDNTIEQLNVKEMYNNDLLNNNDLSYADDSPEFFNFEDFFTI